MPVIDPSMMTPSSAGSPWELEPALARGVSSGARLRREPLILDRAKGAQIIAEDGTRLTDYMLAMGPMLLGHGNEEVLDAVRRQLHEGVLFGTTRGELDLADRLASILPHVDRVAYVTTGSEATALAIRIARGTTGRRLIVKFEGHYHGWLDPLFANTQSNTPAPASTFPVPTTHSVRGQPAPGDIIVIRWNDVDEITRVFEEHGASIAGVILEPIPMNFGVFLPDSAFMTATRELCSRHGAQLIFDEVLSGFRLALGGAAELLGVQPDLAVYAKAIATGFPMAVVAGTNAAMASIVSGPVQPAGTYSGHPVSIAAAHATLDVLEREQQSLYPSLASLGARLSDHIEAAASATGNPIRVNQVGSVLQLFWGIERAPQSYAEAYRSDRAVVGSIAEAQLRSGALVAPRGLILLSAAHTTADIDALGSGLLQAVENAAWASSHRTERRNERT